MILKELIEQLKEIAEKNGNDLEVEIATKRDVEDVEKCAFMKLDVGEKHVRYVRLFGEVAWKKFLED